MDKREEAVQRDVGEDLSAHERLGMRINDKNDDPTDMERDGRIDIAPDSAPF
ncbi:hypothetical protein [Paenibacillus hemerocallicola]|uniref:hypothetical protein n=1 Tax=Paenibacillus hemerocallicola TaxID=1172614 RepID=UPI00159EDA91|nr:hypothetical protein [Paenibacillus hemerocallicola]